MIRRRSAYKLGSVHQERNENPVLLLRVKHKDNILLNPRASEFSGLEESDSLIVMAFEHVKTV